MSKLNFFADNITHINKSPYSECNEQESIFKNLLYINRNLNEKLKNLLPINCHMNLGDNEYNPQREFILPLIASYCRRIEESKNLLKEKAYKISELNRALSEAFAEQEELESAVSQNYDRLIKEGGLNESKVRLLNDKIKQERINRAQNLSVKEDESKLLEENISQIRQKIENERLKNEELNQKLAELDLKLKNEESQSSQNKQNEYKRKCIEQQIKELQLKNNDFDREILLKQSELEHIGDESRAYELKIKSHEQQYREDELKYQVETKEKSEELKRLSESIHKLEQENMIFRNDIISINEDIELSIKEIEAKERNLKDSDGLILSLNEEIQSIKHEIETLNIQLDKSNHEVSELTAELKIIEANKKLCIEKEKERKFKKEIELKNELEDLEKFYNEKEKEFELIKGRLEFEETQLGKKYELIKLENSKILNEITLLSGGNPHSLKEFEKNQLAMIESLKQENEILDKQLREQIDKTENRSFADKILADMRCIERLELEIKNLESEALNCPENNRIDNIMFEFDQKDKLLEFENSKEKLILELERINRQIESKGFK